MKGLYSIRLAPRPVVSREDSLSQSQKDSNSEIMESVGNTLNCNIVDSIGPSISKDANGIEDIENVKAKDNKFEDNIVKSDVVNCNASLNLKTGSE